MASKGKMLNSSAHLSEYPFLALAASGAGEAGGRTPRGEQKAPPPQDSQGVGKRDATLPGPPNSNIAQFNSFSTLVALKKKVKTQKQNRIRGWGENSVSSRGLSQRGRELSRCDRAEGLTRGPRPHRLARRA